MTESWIQITILIQKSSCIMWGYQTIVEVLYVSFAPKKIVSVGATNRGTMYRAYTVYIQL